jgi:hypothetical protein
MATISSITITISPETQKYFRTLKEVLGKAQLYERLVNFFDKQAQVTAGYIVKTKLSGSPLHRRTGALARSIIGRGEILGGTPGFRVGTLRGPAIKYAAVQELGTVGKGGTMPTIKPRTAKALAMPVNDALTPAGVARWQGPRQSPIDLRFVPFRHGTIAVGALYAAKDLQRIHKRGGTLRDILPYYILLSKVDLAPRHFLRNGVLESLPLITANLTTFLSDLIAGRSTKVVK